MVTLDGLLIVMPLPQSLFAEEIRYSFESFAKPIGHIRITRIHRLTIPMRPVEFLELFEKYLRDRQASQLMPLEGLFVS